METKRELKSSVRTQGTLLIAKEEMKYKTKDVYFWNSESHCMYHLNLF